MTQAQPKPLTLVLRRQLFSAPLAGLVLPTRAFGETPITYDDVTALRAILNALAPEQRDKLLVKQGIRERGICDWGCQPLKIWVMSDGKQINVPLANQMWVETLDYNLTGKRLLLNSNSPISLVTDIQIKPPNGNAIPIEYFLDALKQLNRLIHKFERDRKGLLQALLAPEISHLDVYYLGQAGEVRLREGPQVSPFPDRTSDHIPVLLRRDFLTHHRAGVLPFPLRSRKWL